MIEKGREEGFEGVDVKKKVRADHLPANERLTVFEREQAFKVHLDYHRQEETRLHSSWFNSYTNSGKKSCYFNNSLSFRQRYPRAITNKA